MEKKRGGPAAITAGTVEPATPSKGAAAASEETKDDPAKDAEVQRLNMLVKQRDNEIGILLNYLNK